MSKIGSRMGKPSMIGSIRGEGGAGVGLRELDPSVILPFSSFGASNFIIQKIFKK